MSPEERALAIPTAETVQVDLGYKTFTITRHAIGDIAAAIREAVAAEREACARIASSIQWWAPGDCSDSIADTIRLRNAANDGENERWRYERCDESEGGHLCIFDAEHVLRGQASPHFDPAKRIDACVCPKCGAKALYEVRQTHVANLARCAKCREEDWS